MVIPKLSVGDKVRPIGGDRIMTVDALIMVGESDYIELGPVKTPMVYNGLVRCRGFNKDGQMEMALYFNQDDLEII